MCLGRAASLGHTRCSRCGECVGRRGWREGALLRVTRDLGAEASGIQLGREGYIPVNGRLETSAPSPSTRWAMQKAGLRSPTAPSATSASPAPHPQRPAAAQRKRLAADLTSRPGRRRSEHNHPKGMGVLRCLVDRAARHTRRLCPWALRRPVTCPLSRPGQSCIPSFPSARRLAPVTRDNVAAGRSWRRAFTPPNPRRGRAAKSARMEDTGGPRVLVGWFPSAAAATKREEHP
jgi:hypothetical protein